jgi:hypothetical protein
MVITFHLPGWQPAKRLRQGVRQPRIGDVPRAPGQRRAIPFYDQGPACEPGLLLEWTLAPYDDASMKLAAGFIGIRETSPSMKLQLAVPFRR